MLRVPDRPALKAAALIGLIACACSLTAHGNNDAEASAKSPSATKADKPNILVIMGDDVGITNISAYSHGLMGYKTPNIDRIAKEGALFTDYYGEQSCTAGRSAFITGQSPFRPPCRRPDGPRGSRSGMGGVERELSQRGRRGGPELFPTLAPADSVLTRYRGTWP